jgi:hypothetical protein
MRFSSSGPVNFLSALPGQVHRRGGFGAGDLVFHRSLVFPDLVRWNVRSKKSFLIRILTSPVGLPAPRFQTAATVPSVTSMPSYRELAAFDPTLPSPPPEVGHMVLIGIVAIGNPETAPQ